jgi:RNA recognition motif-containing protein
MREKEEREGVETEHVENEWKVVAGRKIQWRKGFVHRLEKDITSFFFSNFPEDATVHDLWYEFEQFGAVGEVYLPKKLGRRFGFVKYRDVKDVRELSKWLEDIWLGSFELRVNLSRFGKGEQKKEKGVVVSEAIRPEKSTIREDSHVDGRSFKEAVVKSQLLPAVEQGVVQGVRQVVWEVEVETEVMTKLQGAYVGFLSEPHEYQIVQQKFKMDGYNNLNIIPLGHKKVLLQSVVRGGGGRVGDFSWMVEYLVR